MGVRKNAKFLTITEREDFVKALVLMKADIINPGAPANQQYSRWDEYVAIHWMIQDAFAPGAPNVNFGHGGPDSYSFLSWHRYFLYQFEKQLQSYVPGVMLPYWDWTDPIAGGIIGPDSLLGPNGTINNEVRSGYFARNAPGTAGNPTIPPAWWPAGLTGWLLPSFFGTGSGALRRRLGPISRLPNANDRAETLAKSTYPIFQNTLESGRGLSNFPAQQMHNGLHGWIGGQTGQMSDPAYSPFDPIFYLHHCNIDRLWAMWQMDGHADEYPSTGGKPHHGRNDIMYPWTGGALGYGTDASIESNIPLPDFSAVGAKRNVDTLDFRNAFDYTYDTLAIIGVGLDRSSSMSGVTPDPMTTTAPDVTKWEAAKRGISAFLQDCETVQEGGIAYVMAGIKTVHRIDSDNDFTTVFSGPGYGLIKNGNTFSRATFESNIAGMSPGGTSPLAVALQDVHNTLVEPPFGRVPLDEQRYLAMLTDGLLTAGPPMSSVPDHSFSQTVVFAMGFGTGADVDYTNLASMVAKGKMLSTQQIFHGENAGTIDKFYSSALAQAIGFSKVIDPVLELFAGEYVHLNFLATSADDIFLITVQGMDFDTENWTFHLHGPDGYMAFGEGMNHSHTSMTGHHDCLPEVTATIGNGRLSLVLERNSADYGCWVGNWQLMVAYKARALDAMLMPTIDELIIPVSAGPVHGPRFSRLLILPKNRKATRNLKIKPAHRLDQRALSTNHNDNQACTVVVNVYARTRLRMEFLPQENVVSDVSGFNTEIVSNVLKGNVVNGRSFARLIGPIDDISSMVGNIKTTQIPKSAMLKDQDEIQFDSAMVLATLEKDNSKLADIRDEEVQVLDEQKGVLQVHVENTEVPGVYHLGVYVEGTYCPEHISPQGGHGHHHEHDHGINSADTSICGPECCVESFSRLLSTTTAVVKKQKEGKATKQKEGKATKKKISRKR